MSAARRLLEAQARIARIALDHELDRQDDITVTTDDWRLAMRAESDRLERMLGDLRPEQYAVLASLTPEQCTAILTSAALPQ